MSGVRCRLRVHSEPERRQLSGVPGGAGVLRERDGGAEGGGVDVGGQRERVLADGVPVGVLQEGRVVGRCGRPGVRGLRGGRGVQSVGVQLVHGVPAGVLQATGGAGRVPGVPGEHVRGAERGDEHGRVRGMHGARDDQGADGSEQLVGVRVRERVLPVGD